MPETKCLATNFPRDSLTLDKSSDGLIVVITFLLANLFRVSIVNCKVSCRWAFVELSYFLHWGRV